MNELDAGPVPAGSNPQTRRFVVSARQLSRWKKLVFTLITATGTYASIELFSLCVLAGFYDGFSANRQRQLTVASSGAVGKREQTSREILHPYLGSVRQPRGGDRITAEQVSSWGFNDDRSPVHHRASGKVVIGILGGSVAEEFARGAGPRLCDALRRARQFAGREIVLVRLALSGYKQPQQLMVVNYLMSQGAEFDVLINIDGFNEAVLPALANVPHGVFASYPQSWQIRMAGSSDRTVLRLIGGLALRRELSQTWADRIARSRARLSPTLNLIWRACDDSLRRGIAHDYDTLSVMLSRHMSYCAMGPPQHFSGPDDLYSHCAGVWMRSSLQLHRLAVANGIRYYHFLQPNQYLPESKVMGHAEMSISLKGEKRYREHVEQGYPWLQRNGISLERQGVRFHDSTRLFATEPQATYRDDCCHYNARGNDMLADEIVRVILADFADR